VKYWNILVLDCGDADISPFIKGHTYDTHSHIHWWKHLAYREGEASLRLMVCRHHGLNFWKRRWRHVCFLASALRFLTCFMCIYYTSGLILVV
jgi:hypothetical protein